MKYTNAAEMNQISKNFDKKYTKKFVMNELKEIAKRGGTYACLPKKDFANSWEFIVLWLTELGYICKEDPTNPNDIFIHWHQNDFTEKARVRAIFTANRSKII
jgi:hypothetical protein